MELVRICASLIDSHEHDYYEVILITEESYKKIKNDDNLIFTICIDGKFYPRPVDIEITKCTENELLNGETDIRGENNPLSWHLYTAFSNHNLNFNEERKRIKRYINSLDSYVHFGVEVRRSQKQKVLDFIDNLNS